MNLERLKRYKEMNLPLTFFENLEAARLYFV